MSQQDTRIKNIINKYIAGNYTPDELDQLLMYLEQEDTNLFDQESVEKWESLAGWPETNSDAERATLMREAQQIIRSSTTSGKGKSSDTAKRIRIDYIWKVAASVAIVISSFWLFSKLSSSGTKAEITYAVVTAGSGETKDVVLPDGSSVSLNSESKLEYPNQFTGDTRTVKLFGEAFFQVTSDDKQRFIVHSPNMEVEVIGTSFNIQDYNNDGISAITVSTGKVMTKSGNNAMDLSAGERLLVDKNAGTFDKQIVEPDKYSLWRSGSLYFDHTPMAEVAEVLQRRYNVHITLQGDINTTVSGEHDNKSLEAVLESICFTSGLKYKKTANGYILYR